MTSLDHLRHPKEKGYFTIMAIIGGLAWLIALPFMLMGFFITIPVLAILILLAWLSSLYHKAVLYGTAVKVTNRQFPEIDLIVKEQARELGISHIPDVFVVNGNGLINALALRVLVKKYVILMGDLVDLLLREGKMDELKMIIGHELGHHAAGHVGIFRNVLIGPGRIIPLISGAYGRACELTADRIGHHLARNHDASKNALIAIALGSRALASRTSIDSFKEQEYDIPWLMGFIHKLYSTHPRTTKRIIELEEFSRYDESVDYNRENVLRPEFKNARTAEINLSEI